MVLFSMLRRPSYSALALAVRAAGSASTFHRAISTVSTFSPDLIRSSSFPTRQFSSATATAAATEQIGSESMIGSLDAQIKRAKEKKVKTPVVPDEFPFEIVDNPGENTILLKREFHGETIEVAVDTLHVDAKDWDDDSDQEDYDDDPGVPMVVSIAKKNDLQLEFGVTGFESQLVIDSLSVPNLFPKKIAYDGPEFFELDDSLQNAFYKYLETRGIGFEITCFLYDYMRKKKSKEFLMWLKNVKGLIG